MQKPEKDERRRAVLGAFVEPALQLLAWRQHAKMDTQTSRIDWPKAIFELVDRYVESPEKYVNYWDFNGTASVKYEFGQSGADVLLILKAMVARHAVSHGFANELQIFADAVGGRFFGCTANEAMREAFIAFHGELNRLSAAAKDGDDAQLCAETRKLCGFKSDVRIDAAGMVNTVNALNECFARREALVRESTQLARDIILGDHARAKKDLLAAYRALADVAQLLAASGTDKKRKRHDETQEDEDGDDECGAAGGAPSLAPETLELVERASKKVKSAESCDEMLEIGGLDVAFLALYDEKPHRL